jgi:hypothetical protein
MTTVTESKTPIDQSSLASMSKRGLDDLFRRSPPGPIPAGRARGTAMAFPGSAVDGVLGRVVRALWWKGKVFDPKGGELRNLIGPFGRPAIRARVYQDQSWFADGAAIILDYSRTSFVARKIRDEIRQVAPDLYLGQVYWGKRRVALFTLEFPHPTS